MAKLTEFEGLTRFEGNLPMSTIEEIDHILNDLGAFIAGCQPEVMVSDAESKLGASSFCAMG
ncbi:hypothetical protein [Bremerella cremea]|uniref:hypothetical protein n=1 Tax=Bremerella cremea TaxID=1031537 RepID=UPI0011C0544C|nr:hypothetical protein [Bremerella cremea]